jgi:hypothetical protein
MEPHTGPAYSGERPDPARIYPAQFYLQHSHHLNGRHDVHAVQLFLPEILPEQKKRISLQQPVCSYIPFVFCSDIREQFLLPAMVAQVLCFFRDLAADAGIYIRVHLYHTIPGTAIQEIPAFYFFKSRHHGPDGLLLCASIYCVFR